MPTSLLPCWVQTPPERVNTHTAPTPGQELIAPAAEVEGALQLPADLPTKTRLRLRVAEGQGARAVEIGGHNVH